MEQPKQEVTVPRGVDIRGTVYGPGTIQVPLNIAQILIERHEAVAGLVIHPDPMASKPASELSADELRALLDKKTGQAAAVTGAGTQPFIGEPVMPPAQMPQRATAPPALEVVKPTGRPEEVDAENMRESLKTALAMSDAELREACGLYEVFIPEGISFENLAVLLADAVDAKKAAAQPITAPDAEVPGALPADFPARDHFMAKKLTTVSAVREAGQDGWGDIAQVDKDKVVGYLATLE